MRGSTRLAAVVASSEWKAVSAANRATHSDSHGMSRTNPTCKSESIVPPRLRIARHGESSVAHQGVDTGVAAAEFAVGFRRIAGVAGRQDVAAAVAAQSSCRTIRPLPGRLRRHRPSACPPRGSCSSRRNSRRCAKMCANCGKRCRITISAGMPSAANVSRSKAAGSICWSPGQMQLHVQQRAGQEFRGGETLVERGGLFECAAPVPPASASPVW